jgi:predicted HicB family RNase H-like nuclease
MKTTADQVRNFAKRYVKLVEWSEEDNCFVGSAPPLIGECCHGATEAKVIDQLTGIVEEWVKTLLEDGEKLPEATANKLYSGKFIIRLRPELHKVLALQALAKGESLNQFVVERLSAASSR